MALHLPPRQIERLLLAFSVYRQLFYRIYFSVQAYFQEDFVKTLRLTTSLRLSMLAKAKILLISIGQRQIVPVYLRVTFMIISI